MKYTSKILSGILLSTILLTSNSFAQNNFDLEERARQYILQKNSEYNLEITPMQQNRWIRLLITHQNRMSNAQNDEEKAALSRQYSNEIKQILRENQIEKINRARNS